MFTLLLVKNGPPHIVSYYNNGIYRTICGENFTKNNKINTLSGDNTFHGICNICRKYFDQMYQADLEYFTADARGTHVFTEEMLSLHRFNIMGPQAKSIDVLDFRFYAKLNKYRRLVSKSNLSSLKNKIK